MYNRYVDGLATWQPLERDAYHDMGQRMAHEGYVRDRFPELETDTKEATRGAA
jgi:hypothetical protein